MQWWCTTRDFQVFWSIPQGAVLGTLQSWEEVCHCATANAPQGQALPQTVLTGRLQLTLSLVNPELHRTEYMNVYVPSRYH